MGFSYNWYTNYPNIWCIPLLFPYFLSHKSIDDYICSISISITFPYFSHQYMSHELVYQVSRHIDHGHPAAQAKTAQAGAPAEAPHWPRRPRRQGSDPGTIAWCSGRSWQLGAHWISLKISGKWVENLGKMGGTWMENGQLFLKIGANW